MSIIGIDFGNESCYVAAAKSGGIETLANDYSLRATPSYVAFSAKTRILGVAAKNQQITNIKNTLFGFKRLLGRSYDDPQTQRECQSLPFASVRQANGAIGIKVSYLNEEHVFGPEQCVAMLLTKLRETAAVALQAPINDCVISVPSYFTNAERIALVNAAAIAGLNCLRLFNETTATALAYGIYKQDLPGAEESPRHVVFVDMGQSALQVFVGAFNCGKLKIIASECEPNIGGRNIDWILADYFCDDFQKRYGLDVKSNPRAFLRLLTEVEKLKKQMSANSTTLPIGIECIMNDRDVSATMKRAEMETLCADLIAKIETVFVKCLRSAQAAFAAATAVESDSRPPELAIHSVEIVGGSTRVPFVKTLIEKVFGIAASTTLNQDEAVSRGCALQCAILSPAVKVRDYAIQDLQPYPIAIAYDEDGKQKTIELFAAGHVIPFAKVLTLMCSQNFHLKAFYSGHVPLAESVLHEWTVKEIKAMGPNDPQKIKIKFRIDHNGILHLISAVQYQKTDAAAMDQSMPQQQSSDMDTGVGEMAAAAAAAATADNDDKENGGDAAAAANEYEMNDALSGFGPHEIADEKPKKKKAQTTSLTLVVETSNASSEAAAIVQRTEEELQMIANDRLEKERIDSKNALEEYVYDLRSKLQSHDDLYEFVRDADRDQLIGELDQLESWLYEEGEDSRRQEYCDKLKALKDKGEPIKQRRLYWKWRLTTTEEFALALQLSEKFCEKWHQNDAQYAHIASDDVEKVRALTAEKTKWLDEQRVLFANWEKFEDPAKSYVNMQKYLREYQVIVNPIIQKPAPKEDAKSAQPPPSSAESNKNATGADDDSQSTKPDSAATINGTNGGSGQSQMDTTE